MIVNIKNIPNDDSETLVLYLRQTQFWSNYGLSDKTFIVNRYFPNVNISDNIIVQTIRNTLSNQSYDFIIPYGEMLFPEFREQLIQFQNYLFEKYSIKLYLLETVRSKEEQDKIENNPINILKNNYKNISDEPPLHVMGLQVKYIPILVKEDTIEFWIYDTNSKYFQLIDDQQKQFNLNIIDKITISYPIYK